MLKQNLRWEGPTGTPMNKTFYFNLTRFEISHDMELEKLEERFKRFKEDVIGPEDAPDRKMTPPEIREMLSLVRTIVKHAYGVLTEGPDGTEFNKTEEIWQRFDATGAFDAFIWYLFDDPTRANAFMSGIWPKEIQAEIEKEQRRQSIRVVGDVETEGFPPGDIIQSPPVAPDDDGIPSIESGVAVVTTLPERPVKAWLDHSEDELLAMGDAEFETLYAQATKGNNVPPIMLVLRHKRQQREGSTE